MLRGRRKKAKSKKGEKEKKGNKRVQQVYKDKRARTEYFTTRYCTHSSFTPTELMAYVNISTLTVTTTFVMTPRAVCKHQKLES